MARPRVFISSTFYDLRQVRSDIERFVRELGYEPVRHETGSVPYSKDERLEVGAYREIELSDIIVFITGGNFGTESEEEPGYSISQVELKRALESGKQVFIFVETSVLNEYHTYKLNKTASEIKYYSVSNVKVFEFLEELYSLPSNNPITQFEIATDITNFLKEQFAGLFHRFLQDQKRFTEVRVLEQMNSVASTLQQLVGFLTKERKNKDEAIKSILLANHPAFKRLAILTRTPYRVFFSTREEMQNWLTARRWESISSDELDSDSVAEWRNSGWKKYLKLKKEIFDKNDRLVSYTADTWNDEWIELVGQVSEVSDDDIPF